MTALRAVLFALTLVGCDSSPTAVSVGESFVLAHGQTALVSGGGPRVRFERVVQDSRCPSDVVCVQAGEVVVEVTIGDGTADRVSLRPGQSAAWGAYTVRLVSVDPYPRSTAPVEPSRYRATFLVEHDSGG